MVVIFRYSVHSLDLNFHQEKAVSMGLDGTVRHPALAGCKHPERHYNSTATGAGIVIKSRINVTKELIY